MSYSIKIAEFDLSVFTGTNTQVVLTAEESEHGYDYHVTTCIEDSALPAGYIKQTLNFYDQATAESAVNHLKNCVLAFLENTD